MASWNSQWGRASSEDERTALVFGFFRHLPHSVGLEALLRESTGLDLRMERGLRPSDFWPQWSLGGRRVVPDLAFPASLDGKPATVVVEAKRTSEEHTLRQVTSEIEAALHASPDRRSVLLVTVGSSREQRFDPNDLAAQFDDARIEHAHMRWADLGATVQQLGSGMWRTYAEDVLAVMRRAGLAKDPGLPDSASVELPSALAEVSRFSVAARDFVVRLDEDAAPALGLELRSGSGKRRRVYRTGTSQHADSSPRWFELGVVYGTWMRPGWRAKRKIIAGIDLRYESGPQIIVGPAVARDRALNIMLTVGEADEPVYNVGLARRSRFVNRLAIEYEGEMREFRFISKPWTSDISADVAWVADQMSEALDLLDEVDSNVFASGPLNPEGWWPDSTVGGVESDDEDLDC